MPLTPIGLAGVLIPALASSSMAGTAVPQFATGIANGAVLYVQSATVTTVDTGTLGSGVGTLPLIVPQPLLLGNLLSGFTSAGVTGVMAPPLAVGVANGLASGFLQGLISTTHPTVGTGTGVVRVVASTAVPQMIAGFAGAGMTGAGAVRMATGIGIALDLTFSAFTTATPIVGASSPTGGGGVGFGKIV